MARWRDGTLMTGQRTQWAGGKKAGADTRVQGSASDAEGAARALRGPQSPRAGAGMLAPEPKGPGKFASGAWRIAIILDFDAKIAAEV